MLKFVTTVVVLCVLLVSSVAIAQSVRSLAGTLILDVGLSEFDRDIEITVRNHSIVIIPPAFLILRPVTSSESTVVKMRAGRSQVSYFIGNILTDPIDYSISIRCLGCANEIPNQYYALTGNTLGLGNSAYIDPTELANSVNLTAITRATIKGAIDLNLIAERDLQFTLTVFSEQSAALIYKTVSGITLAAGTKVTSYSITALNRAIGSDRYRVELKCTNCFGVSRRSQRFAESLSPNQNYSNIDFSVTDIPPPALAPALLLVLE